MPTKKVSSTKKVEKPVVTTSTNTNSSFAPEKKLLRSKSDRVIGGVCGGLGKYFNIDPVIIRLLFALISISGGSGVLAYIILWVVIPEEGDEGKSTEQVVRDNGQEIKKKADQIAKSVEQLARERNSQIWIGIGVIFLGVFLTLSAFGLGNIFNFGWYMSKLWPLLVIALGVVILVKTSNGEQK